MEEAFLAVPGLDWPDASPPWHRPAPKIRCRACDLS
jgi:hypothetical protein